MGTPQHPPETTIVQLADIEDDPGWITDEQQVNEFRATLQSGKPFAGLLLRRMPPGTDGHPFEIIDGFCRYRALRAEGKVAYQATVYDYDEREADQTRMQASIDKSDHIRNSRAVYVIRRRLVLDQILTMIQNAPLLERIWKEDKSVDTRLRSDSIPNTYSAVYQALYEHMIAVNINERRSQEPTAHERLAPIAYFVPKEEWEKQVGAWLEEMGQWVGYKHRVEDILRYVLSIELRGDADHYGYIRTILHQVASRPIRTLLLERYSLEGYYESGRGYRSGPFSLLLEHLGVGGEWGTPEWFHRPIERSESEILELLESYTLGALKGQAIQAMAEDKAAFEEEQNRLYYESERGQAMLRQISNAQEKFVESLTTGWETPAERVHAATEELLEALAAYAEVGGKWQGKAILRDLQRILPVAQQFIDTSDKKKPTKPKQDKPI